MIRKFKIYLEKELKVKIVKDRAVIFFIGLVGYMLSPLSPYNDLFVNILPSIFLAGLTKNFIDIPLIYLSIFYYIMSNIIGIIMLAYAAKKLSLTIRIKPTMSYIITITIMILLVLISFFLFDFTSLISTLTKEM